MALDRCGYGRPFARRPRRLRGHGARLEQRERLRGLVGKLPRAVALRLPTTSNNGLVGRRDGRDAWGEVRCNLTLRDGVVGVLAIAGGLWVRHAKAGERHVDLTAGEAAAGRSLVEGPAMLVQYLYARRYLAFRGALNQFLQRFRASADRQLHLSGILLADAVLPYVGGAPFVAHLVASGGWSAVSAAELRPPASTAELLGKMIRGEGRLHASTPQESSGVAGWPSLRRRSATTTPRPCSPAAFPSPPVRCSGFGTAGICNCGRTSGPPEWEAVSVLAPAITRFWPAGDGPTQRPPERSLLRSVDRSPQPPTASGQGWDQRARSPPKAA